jgi:hypothetical protein
MSGGAFDYNQYRIKEIYEHIEEAITREIYQHDVIEKMKEGIEILKKAEIYAQRIDWLLSGDDGEESFLSRLEKDLKNLKL